MVLLETVRFSFMCESDVSTNLLVPAISLRSFTQSSDSSFEINEQLKVAEFGAQT
jgi:hypothetical protein